MTKKLKCCFMFGLSLMYSIVNLFDVVHRESMKVVFI
jgi:hypothetical protein